MPAFVGLGAPYWDAEARGAIYGLTRNSGPAEFARAALESVAFQTADLLEAMHSDWAGRGAETVLRVDGGMTASDWTMQRLADLLGAAVDRPKVLETTALGAAYLAGLASGIYPEPAEFAKSWALERRFTPAMPAETRSKRLALWKDAVRRTLTALNHVPFEQRRVREHAFRREIREVEAGITPIRDEFGEPTPHGGGLLQAVAGKAAGDVAILQARHSPHQRVVIEQIHVVMPGPGTAGADGLEGRDARGERGPDHLLEKRPIDLEIGGVIGFIEIIRRITGDVAFALGPPPHAGLVDDEGVTRERFLAGKAENAALLREDRHGNPSRPRAPARRMRQRHSPARHSRCGCHRRA